MIYFTTFYSVFFSVFILIRANNINSNSNIVIFIVMDNKKIYKYLGISLLLSLIVILVVLVIYYSFNRNNTSKDKFENEGSYPFVSGNTIKITCQNCDNLPPHYKPANGSDVNLFGVFIYGKDGKLLNTEPSSGIAELSSAYGFTLPENALKYSVEYRSRILSEALPLTGQLPIDSRWEYNTLGYVSASGSTPSSGTNPGWWAYKFNSPQDISGIEIYSRSDNCAERISNALIQIFDSSNNEVWRTNFRNITKVTGEYNRPVNPEDVWETFSVIPSATTTNYSSSSSTQPETTTYYPPTPTYSQPETTNYSQPQPTPTYTQYINTNIPIYQSVSCKYLVITAPAVNIAGLLIIDKYGNNMFYNADVTKFYAFQLGNMETCANSILQTNKINLHISNLKMYSENYSRLNIESNNRVSITNGQVGNSKIPNPVSNENAQLMIDLNPNNNDLVNINSIILIHNINTNCEINEPNLPNMVLPNMFNTSLNNMCSLGLIGGNISLYGEDFRPLFKNYISRCIDSNNPTITFTQQPKTLAKWYFPKYTSLVSQYTPSSTQELLQQSQQYYIPILSSILTLNQISSFKNIHEKFVDMNTGIGILYPDPKVPITVNPGKSIDASNSIFSILATNYTQPETTNYSSSSSSTQPATTNYSQPTTTFPQLTNTISISTIPLISPSQTIALLNTGANVDTLTAQGIAMNSAFRGPSTNIVQTNFSGTSNIYSPYLFYNKGLSESFSGNTTDTGKNYFSY